MKVALDTDVIIAARQSRSGASNALLRALRAGQMEAVASVPMMLEYEAVLMRPEQRLVMGMSVQEVNALLDSLAVLLTPVIPYFLWCPRLRDPDDEMVLEAAVNSSAEAIVTFNKRDFLPEATQFNLQVLTPAEALWQLALRLLSSLKAKAEKLAALRTEHYFEERAKRADLSAFDHFLERAGDAPPRPGDEILPDSP